MLIFFLVVVPFRITWPTVAICDFENELVTFEIPAGASFVTVISSAVDVDFSCVCPLVSDANSDYDADNNNSNDRITKSTMAI